MLNHRVKLTLIDPISLTPVQLEELQTSITSIFDDFNQKIDKLSEAIKVEQDKKVELAQTETKRIELLIQNARNDIKSKTDESKLFQQKIEALIETTEKIESVDVQNALSSFKILKTEFEKLITGLADIDIETNYAGVSAVLKSIDNKKLEIVEKEKELEKQVWIPRLQKILDDIDELKRLKVLDDEDVSEELKEQINRVNQQLSQLKKSERTDKIDSHLKSGISFYNYLEILIRTALNQKKTKQIEINVEMFDDAKIIRRRATKDFVIFEYVEVKDAYDQLNLDLSDHLQNVKKLD
jgi:hypothetical protein